MKHDARNGAHSRKLADEKGHCRPCSRIKELTEGAAELRRRIVAGEASAQDQRDLNWLWATGRLNALDTQQE